MCHTFTNFYRLYLKDLECGVYTLKTFEMKSYPKFSLQFTVWLTKGGHFECLAVNYDMFVISMYIIENLRNSADW